MYEQTKERMRRFMAKKMVPGYSYAFIEGDRVEKGMTGKAAERPMPEELRPGMQYDLASLTKVMAALPTLLQLWENGQLDLEAPVKRYLSAFRDERVRIRHLLTHTSGLHQVIPNRDGLRPEQLIGAYFAMRREEDFDRKIIYTDANFIVLGLVIESLTSKTVWENFRERVKEPLRLSDSTYFPSDRSRCVPTAPDGPHDFLRGTVHDPKARLLGEHCGSAGLFASLEDVTVFCRMLLSGGSWAEERILKAATIQALNRVWADDGEKKRSLGWDVFPGTDTLTLSHTGYTGSFIMLDITRQQGFIFLSNRVHLKDDRAAWIRERDQLMSLYQQERTRPQQRES